MSLPAIGLGSMFTPKKPRHKATSRDRVVVTNASTTLGNGSNLIHYNHDYPSQRCPQTPAPMPSTIVGLEHPAPAFFPYGSGTNSHTSATPSQKSEPPEAKILVMGATGSGKSSFINLASGSSLEVGKGLQSCTNAVQMAEAFDLDGRRVVLIDTPGFNDTTQSDTEVLRVIVAFLQASYEQGDMLAGVLYFHRISDLRMGGAQTKNFKMFQNLCGEEALGNVVIVTNMWSRVEPEVGEAREAELMGDDMFFKPAIARNARMARHENTTSSAEEIIRLLVNNRPLPLQIQRELVNEGKDILETSAGQELDQELNNEIRKHKEEIRVLTEEMEQATRDKDEETRIELEIETRRMQEQLRRVEEEARRLTSSYWRDKREFQVHLAELKREEQGGYHRTERPLPAVPYHSTRTAGGEFANASRQSSQRNFPLGLGSARTMYRTFRENFI